jgi:hypothetical protein
MRNDHAACTEWFRRNDDVLLVLPTVVAEACYLIGQVPRARRRGRLPGQRGQRRQLRLPAGGAGRLRHPPHGRTRARLRRPAPGRDRRFCDRGVRAARDRHGRHRQPPRLCQRPSPPRGGAHHSPLTSSRGLPEQAMCRKGIRAQHADLSGRDTKATAHAADRVCAGERSAVPDRGVPTSAPSPEVTCPACGVRSPEVRWWLPGPPQATYSGDESENTT